MKETAFFLKPGTIKYQVGLETGWKSLFWNWSLQTRIWKCFSVLQFWLLILLNFIFGFETKICKCSGSKIKILLTSFKPKIYSMFETNWKMKSWSPSLIYFFRWVTLHDLHFFLFFIFFIFTYWLQWFVPFFLFHKLSYIDSCNFGIVGLPRQWEFATTV